MSVTAAGGFRAAGVACGLKSDDLADLALLVTADAAPVSAAGIFTTNRLTAAPVVVTRRHLASTGGRAAAVVVNSGNANAATGEAGLAASEDTCAAVAAQLGCRPEEVLVCSTGLIGIPMPVDRIIDAVPSVVDELDGGPEGAIAAAEAIRTTDTVRKEAVAAVSTPDGRRVVVGGMAKGAGMLAPDMATMLAFLTTDAAVEPDMLQELLVDAAAESFNALTVDGCTSTNDTVLALADGSAGPIDGELLAEAMRAVCAELALRMAEDAEGATKVVRVRVTGASSDTDARCAARRTADSVLVKTSWYGSQAYWGRVASELGSAGVAFDPERLTIAYGGVTVCEGGVEVAHDAAAVAAHVSGSHLDVHADLGLGDGRGAILTTDLGHGYVDENMGLS